MRRVRTVPGRLVGEAGLELPRERAGWQRVHLLCVGAVGSVDKGKADLVAGQGQAGEAELQQVPTTDRFGSSEL